MKKFLIYYWVNIIILFGLFYVDFSPFSWLINQIQSEVTLLLTSWTLPAGMMSGHEILINSHYSLVIQKACNGMIPYLFFIASIFAFPATNLHKIKWIVYGYIAITIVNTFRIWLVTQFVLESRENFFLAHDLIGNVLVIVSSLILFTLFVHSREKMITQIYHAEKIYQEAN